MSQQFRTNERLHLHTQQKDIFFDKHTHIHELITYTRSPAQKPESKVALSLGKKTYGNPGKDDLKQSFMVTLERLKRWRTSNL